MFAMSLRGYKWNKLSERVQVEPTSLCKSELDEKPSRTTHKQANKTKNNIKSPKIMESSLAGVAQFRGVEVDQFLHCFISV